MAFKLTLTLPTLDNIQGAGICTGRWTAPVSGTLERTLEELLNLRQDSGVCTGSDVAFRHAQPLVMCMSPTTTLWPAINGILSRYNATIGSKIYLYTYQVH